jgi:hypothetical protein
MNLPRYKAIYLSVCRKTDWTGAALYSLKRWMECLKINQLTVQPFFNYFLINKEKRIYEYIYKIVVTTTISEAIFCFQVFFIQLKQ